MKALRIAKSDKRDLLSKVLETPDLVATVQSLEPRVLGALVDRIGIEDAGEIVAMATAEQLLHMFDEALWDSDRPGSEERFDPARFAVWLEVMLEAGDAFVAERLTDLPEDLVIAAFHSQMLVLDMNELGVQMAYAERDDAERTERLLECAQSQELGEYLLLSKRPDGFDAVVSVLTALDRDHHDFLLRLLERCCAASSSYVEESGGLWEVLSSEEMLESDAAADREDRRSRRGYVSPSSARSFLALAKSQRPDEVISSKQRDPITKAYFRELEAVPRPLPAFSPIRNRKEPPPLDGLLREMGALPDTAPSLLLGAVTDPFRLAMASLLESNPTAHAARMSELAYLANVLVSGAALDGRRYLPMEAAKAAVEVCAEGFAFALAKSRRRAVDPSELLTRFSADALFRIGWHERG